MIEGVTPQETSVLERVSTITSSTKLLVLAVVEKGEGYSREELHAKANDLMGEPVNSIRDGILPVTSFWDPLNKLELDGYILKTRSRGKISLTDNGQVAQDLAIAMLDFAAYSGIASKHVYGQSNQVIQTALNSYLMMKRLLLAYENNHTMSQYELAQFLSINQSPVSKRISEWIRAGFVQSSSSEEGAMARISVVDYREPVCSEANKRRIDIFHRAINIVSEPAANLDAFQSKFQKVRHELLNDPKRLKKAVQVSLGNRKR